MGKKAGHEVAGTGQNIEACLSSAAADEGGCALQFADPANRLLELELIRCAHGPLQGPKSATQQIVEKPRTQLNSNSRT